MRRSRILVFLLLAFTSSLKADPKPVLDGPDGQKAFTDLATYYADGKTKPPYEQALADLGAGGDTAQHAGQYLLGLFEQSMADETNGRAVWKRQTFWGGGSQSPSRDFRKELAGKFQESAKGDAALPATLWLINEEKMPDGEVAGITVLREIQSPAAIDAIGKIIAQPHPNEDVLIGAIEEVGKRQLKSLQPNVATLENSYRKAVRQAANKTMETFGDNQLRAFEPTTAFTPDLTALIQKIADRVYTPIPADAKWMDIVYTDPRGFAGNKPRKASGWLLREEGDDYVILNWQGMETRMPKKTTVLTPGTLADTGKKLVAIRKDNSREKRDELSLDGGLTSQFEPGFITVPEALVSAWSFARGDKATAAAVLFPCFDQAKDDRWIDWAIRDMLGNRYHQKMLDEFAMDRDYPATIQLAQHLSKPIFDGFNYQDRAKELAAQLPKRMDDFKTFTLPTPDDWTKQSATMKRPEQVAFLGAHMRLLNCVQMSQPGGVNYTDPQYAQAYAEIYKTPGMTKTVLINPYNELKKMALTPADIEVLLPYTVDDNFMPTYSYWRNFHPGRTLHRVSWAVSDLVNDAAQQTLVDLSELESMDADGKNQALEKIKAWCTAHANQSPEDLLADTIQKTKDKDDFLVSAGKALELKKPELLKLAAARATDFPNWSAAAKVAQMCFQSGAPGFDEQARAWIKATDAQAATDAAKPPKAPDAPVYLGQVDPPFADYSVTRFWSALILLRDSPPDKPEGLEVLEPLFKADDGSFYYPKAMATLLATKNEKCMALACGVLKKPALLTTPWDTADQIKQLFLAGRPECHDFIIAELNDTTQEGEATHPVKIDGKEVQEPSFKSGGIADIVSQWRIGAFRIDGNMPNAEQLKKRKELIKWIDEQFELIKQGKGSKEMDSRINTNISEWRADAP